MGRRALSLIRPYPAAIIVSLAKLKTPARRVTLCRVPLLQQYHAVSGSPAKAAGEGVAQHELPQRLIQRPQHRLPGVLHHLRGPGPAPAAFAGEPETAWYTQ